MDLIENFVVWLWDVYKIFFLGIQFAKNKQNTDTCPKKTFHKLESQYTPENEVSLKLRIFCVNKWLNFENISHDTIFNTRIDMKHLKF